MQPSLAMRGHALGRHWGGAGRCAVALPLLQAALTPRCLHTQDPAKHAEGDALDSFIVKFQQILSKARKPRRPSKATKGKGVKGLSPPTKRPYQPFTTRTQGNVAGGVETHPDQTNATQMKDSEPGGVRSGVRSGDDKEDRTLEVEEGEITPPTPHHCTTPSNMEQKGATVSGDDGNTNLTSHSSPHTQTCTQLKQTHTHTHDKETNVCTDGQPRNTQETIGDTSTREVEGGGGGGVLSSEQHTLVGLILDGVSKCKNRDLLENCYRQNTVPPFEMLRRLCAGASVSATEQTVRHIKKLTNTLHPALYIKHMGLDYYWACALCHGEDVEQSLAVLLHLHHQTHSQRCKKVDDVTQLVLYSVVEKGDDHVAKVMRGIFSLSLSLSLSLSHVPLFVLQAVEFVDTIATELGHVGPALSLWSATFTSPLFRVQQVSEWLVERHPGLVEGVGRRVEGLVEKAAWACDLELLQRILHLALRHRMATHYQTATSALLRLQCDEGDLRGAEETIKFCQQMEVRLTPPALHRFLALLSRHRRPAPLTLLALKYNPPPARPPIPPPPTPKYRF